MAGAGFKTFNTGDVLTASDVNTYLMQQTVMVFANSSARSTALGANVSEGMLSYLTATDALEYYNGSTWVSAGASGDITAVNAGAGLSGGGTSGDVTLSLNALSAGRNFLVNGGHDIWQRGTSIAVGASATVYTADRWAAYRNATGSTVSRQATGDTTNLPFVQYCARVQRDSGNTSTTLIQYAQMLESANSIPLAGRTVVLSFYARKGANYSSASDALTVNLFTGTGTDQNIYSGFTGQATVINQTATLTSTWQRFSYSVTLAGSVTQLASYFAFTPVGTAGANDYFEITGVQLELGSSATPFSRAGGNIQAELAACQRYYWRCPGTSSDSYTATAVNKTTTTAIASFQNPVPMRGNPAITIVNPTSAWFYYLNGSAQSISSFQTSGALRAQYFDLNFTFPTASTAGYAGLVYTGGGSSTYIDVSAEL